MTQLISFLHSLLTAVRTGRLGLLPIRIYRGNNAVFVSVDLIGEKNQVILEYLINVAIYHNMYFNMTINRNSNTFLGQQYPALTDGEEER